MYKYDNNLAQAILGAVKTQLDGGFLYLFAGTVPAEAYDALNMGAIHTFIAKYSLNGGATGLTFAAPTGLLLPKTAAENWQATTAFDGAQAGLSTLSATFWRFCKGSDNGRTAGSAGPRLQGLAGNKDSSAELKLFTYPVPNATVIGCNTFNIRLGSVG